MNLKQLLQEKEVQPYLLAAYFGVEKESQRTTLTGDLAKTDHPSLFGSRSYHPYIQTDFSETQVEIITPVVHSEKEVIRFLAAIHDVVYRSMPETEMLWPLSMPPVLPEKEEDIKIAKLEQFDAVLYRRYLAREYGRRKQMISGIHFNFEFSEELIQQLFEKQEIIHCIEAFKTEVYMKVARNFLRYRWVLTYLFGASPVSEKGYFLENEERPNEPVRSIRNSRFGYRNREDIQVSYASLQQYIEDIHELVEKGCLSEEKEFYSPIRLRGGKQVADLPQSGIRYIELRNLDLNPFALYGIDEETLQFLHLFMLYLLWTDEGADSKEWIAQGDKLNDQVALSHPLESLTLQEEGEQIFAEMVQMLADLQLEQQATLVEHYAKQLRQPALTIAARMVTKIKESSNHELGVSLGKGYQSVAFQYPYQLSGFRNMELSTQLLLFDAIQKGIEVEILDESEQFLKLKHQQHIEYVKNANMTSLDRYIVPLIMENKTVTKKVLAKAGFHVPKGDEFDAMSQAEAVYLKYAHKAFVIKPKTTNYGLGITIFKQGATFEDFKEALRLAFAEDTGVLIEEFIEGTEYRFFVLNNEVKAIMLRIPANVIGDGTATIEELVATKNLEPLRGSHHRAPLEKIQLGDVEKLMLKEQGLTIKSIPKAGQQVFLRENSNVSTGGDSIDMTDDFDASYKKIAVEAVAALGAKICGIDLIIPDKQIIGKKEKPATYGIIEANFNPAMHMHAYPHTGKGRALTTEVLKLLYPEIG